MQTKHEPNINLDYWAKCENIKPFFKKKKKQHTEEHYDGFTIAAPMDI